MAEGKNKIIVYRDWIGTFESLTDEEAGRLIKHFFRYVNDLNPEPADRITSLLFEPIKQTLKRDLKKYEEICLRNRNNGQGGGRPVKTEDNPKKPTGLKINPKKPDSDSDSDIDSDNGIIKPDKPANKYNFIDSLISEFASEYEFQRDLQYNIINKGKERAAASKILGKFKDRFPDYNSDQITKEIRSYFKLCISINDTWLWNNMSLSMIVSKFNEINNILRNGKHRGNNGATPEQIAATIGKHFASDSEQ